MGLTDGLHEAAREQQGRLDDAVRTLVEPGDTMVAAAAGPHLASTGKAGRREGVNLTWLSGVKLTDVLIKPLMRARARQRHVGGAEGSIGRSLPIDLPTSTLVLTEQWFMVCDLGQALDREPLLEFRCPRSEVASIEVVKDGSWGQRTTRITFRDGSFGVYRLVANEANAAFWA